MYKKIKESISDDLCIDCSYIDSVIKRSYRLYKMYKIPKRNGKERTIFQPSKELKTLQYWMIENILSKFEISDNAFAYRKGVSIKNNALIHLKTNHIFHTDIKSFFPSIDDKKLYAFLDKHRDIIVNNDLYFDDIYENILKICFRKNILCIGSPSSPIISNIIMYDFDNELDAYCKNNDLIYTRYADDIYISSNNYIDNNLFTFVNTLLTKYGFSINRDKTQYKSGNFNVTGITLVDKNKISIGYNSKKYIKNMIYQFIKYGRGNKKEILGYLAYLKDIDPLYFNKLDIKYMKYVDKDILTFIKTR